MGMVYAPIDVDGPDVLFAVVAEPIAHGAGPRARLAGLGGK